MLRLYDISGNPSEVEKWVQHVPLDSIVIHFVGLDSLDQLVEDGCDFAENEVGSLFGSGYTYSWYNEGALRSIFHESRDILRTVLLPRYPNVVLLVFTKADLLGRTMRNSDLGKYFPEFPYVLNEDVDEGILNLKKVLLPWFHDAMPRRETHNVVYQFLCLSGNDQDIRDLTRVVRRIIQRPYTMLSLT